MHLVRAAKVVRREMFKHTFSFDGSFTEKCQESVIPHSLLALIKMILEGPNIKFQTQLAHTADSKAALSISHLLVFNSVKHT